MFSSVSPRATVEKFAATTLQRRSAVASVLLEPMRRDQHIREFMERPSRRPAVRLGLRGILPPDIKRGAAKASIFERRIKRILANDRRPRHIDQQRARFHQGKAAGVDQPFRLRGEPARDKDRVAQRQHAIEFGQGEDGFRRRGIGDWAAVGDEDSAF